MIVDVQAVQATGHPPRSANVSNFASSMGWLVKKARTVLMRSFCFKPAARTWYRHTTGRTRHEMQKKCLSRASDGRYGAFVDADILVEGSSEGVLSGLKFAVKDLYDVRTFSLHLAVLWSVLLSSDT